MNRPLLLAAVLPLATACSSVSGVWMVVIPYQEAAVTCQTSINENYVDGYAPEDGSGPVTGDWTFTEDYVGSDALMFVQIETTVGGEAVLVMGNQAWPGVKDQGSWLFTWTDGYEDTQTTEHTSGYSFTEASSYASTSSISLSVTGFGGDSATGLITQDEEASEGYVESDEWDDDVRDYIGTTGQTPSSDYLVYDDGGDERPQYNDYDVADCTGDCQLTVTTTCTGSMDFTAVRTDYSDEDTFQYLMSTTNGG